VTASWEENQKISEVLIVDFGSQLTQLIARRVRALNVFCEIVPCYSVTESFLKTHKFSAFILSGAPATAVESDGAAKTGLPLLIYELGIPVLGICYGQHILTAQLGGVVGQCENREFGRTHVTVSENTELFDGIAQIGDTLEVWMSHGDYVSKLPPGFVTFATSAGSAHAIIGDEKRKIYGVQFHPEADHTIQGTEIIRNFLYKIAGVAGNWKMEAYHTQALRQICEKVGKCRVVCGVSGGIDSAVASLLIHEAIGEHLTCIFVDTGLLRKNEAQEVVRLFGDNYSVNLIHVEASKQFFDALKGVVDPEEKRKRIGELFVNIFESEGKKIGVGDTDFLAQGTLYPDVVESVSSFGGPSVVIKSHHNVGGLPEHMTLKLLEPLRSLFKDEVRELAREMGLPDSFIRRHPFPGPGLAIRIIGEVTQEAVSLLQDVDDIYLTAIRESGLYDEIWQAFAVLLPVKTVGVMGDSRTYENVCVLRAVTSTDGMTADFYPFSQDWLGMVSNRIISKVYGVNRVVYDITSKPPGTIEWE
jgi:GMP synthase (glutamine-hydrolysing)